uniref:Miff domain-containing protein n=1 Tax=Mesocestoides corti TaxID=53468 RepID=A0A5K3EVM7_MESCO
MDPSISAKNIDVDLTTDISARMQIPNRLSLIMPDFPSVDSVRGTESRVVITGSNKSNHLHNPYDFPVSRPSLEPPPESLVLGQVNYPDIDRISKPRYPPVNPSKETSNLSLFHGSVYGAVDDDRTLIDQGPLNSSAEALADPSSVALETQLQDLVVRVSMLEDAIARQHRRELLALILLGTYFLLKFGRSLL